MDDVTRDALLELLLDEMNRGQVYECSIRSNKWQVFGLQEGSNIYIDPRPALVETVLHETLHRLKPRWGERTVTRVAHRLTMVMTEEQKWQWWRAYRKVRKVRRPKDVD